MKIFQKLKVGTLLSVCCVSLFSLLFIACGSNTPESIIKEKHPNDTILSIEEVKKELGFIDSEECLYEKRGFTGALYSHYFLKDKEGVITVINFDPDPEILTDKKSKEIALKYMNKQSLEDFKKSKQMDHFKCFQ